MQKCGFVEPSAKLNDNNFNKHPSKQRFNKFDFI